MKLRWKVPLVIFVVIVMWLSIGVSHRFIMYSDNYNCTHMSRDFEDVVETFGIPVTLMRGQGEKGGHLWVKVCGVEFSAIYLIPFPEHIFSPEIQREFDDWEDYCEFMRIDP